MNTRLRAYVDDLFENAPTTTRVYDLKEELLANLEEKFEDLTAAGYSEGEAYASVVSGLGDAEALIESLSLEPEAPEPIDPTGESQRVHTAQVVSTSAFLYCVAIAAYLLLRMVLGSTLAWVGFWVITGFATAQTVYHFMTRPTPVGGRRISLDGLSRKQRKRLRGTCSSVLWLSTTILYVIISFSVRAWHLTWIIFLVSAIIEQLITLFFKMDENGKEEE